MQHQRSKAQHLQKAHPMPESGGRGSPTLEDEEGRILEAVQNEGEVQQEPVRKKTRRRMRRKGPDVEREDDTQKKEKEETENTTPVSQSQMPAPSWFSECNHTWQPCRIKRRKGQDCHQCGEKRAHSAKMWLCLSCHGYMCGRCHDCAIGRDRKHGSKAQQGGAHNNGIFAIEDGGRTKPVCADPTSVSEVLQLLPPVSPKPLLKHVPRVHEQRWTAIVVEQMKEAMAESDSAAAQILLRLPLMILPVLKVGRENLPLYCHECWLSMPCWAMRYSSMTLPIFCKLWQFLTLSSTGSTVRSRGDIERSIPMSLRSVNGH